MVRVAQNPQDIRAVFGIVDGLRHLAGGKFEQRVLDHMRLKPETAALIDARYTAPLPDVSELLGLPEGTLGRAFAEHLSARGLSTDFYPIKTVSDEASFVAMRMRRTHDIWHVVTGFDTDVPGELGVQAFMLSQLHTPFAILLLTIGLVRSLWTPESLEPVMNAAARGWSMGQVSRPLFAQKWELSWERPLVELRRELGIASFFLAD
jgi:ubiquinone biosynthesis protein Coq4